MRNWNSLLTRLNLLQVRYFHFKKNQWKKTPVSGRFSVNILFVATILTFSACHNGQVKQNLLPGVSGKAGEVVIVMEKPLWNGEQGAFLKENLLQDVPGLPQSEPIFNPININHKAFSDLFKIHRNLILIRLNPEQQTPVFKAKNDVWAQPQLVIEIVAANKKELTEVLQENRDKLLGLLFKAERDRLMDNYARYPENKTVEALKSDLGVKLNIPKGYTYGLDTTDFVWISHEPPAVTQGIFIYRYPFTDDSTFTKPYLIAKRNEILKQFVSGEGAGSYMTTESQVPVEFKAYEWKGAYTAELRGLWKVEGDFMGGPFVSLSRVNEKEGMVYTVEGFVYAPRYDKRNYMRQLEAILYSFEFAK